MYPDPVRIVSIGQKVEDLLANPENEEWSSYSAELCGGIFLLSSKYYLWEYIMNYGLFQLTNLWILRNTHF